MECRLNIGKAERRIRLSLGVILIGLAGLTALPEWASLAAFGVGVIALFTGIRQFCPLWKLLRINRCEHHP